MSTWMRWCRNDKGQQKQTTNMQQMRSSNIEAACLVECSWAANMLPYLGHDYTEQKHCKTWLLGLE
jgi:hypothetical protein